MGGNSNGVIGPDLVAGISSDRVAEGQSLAGRVGDDAVLIARSGGRCYAVGATCSHYGGPLADGLVVDGTVRCPWHHAAFRLDTGEATRPPAFDALPCWNVEEEDGVVRVLERVAPRPPARVVRATPVTIVIVGAGAAGVSAAGTLRKEGFQGRIVMVDPDADAPVDRPNLSKEYLAGSAQEEWVTLRGDDWFREREIALMRSRRVITLNALEKRIRLDDGTLLHYDTVLLATGAVPIQLALPTSAHPPVYTLRSLADSRAIIAAASNAGAGAAVVMFGASFIGLEVAASLRARGLEVHVVAPHANPLERVLGPQLGDWIKRLHEQHGVIFHLGEKRRELVADGVVLGSGEHIPASFVVAGIGVRPDADLAARAGLRVDRGVVVNAQLRASAPGVFAAGDVARYPDPRTGQLISVEHWVAAQRQGQTAACNMLGGNDPFTAVPFFWSTHFDAVISYVGHAEQWDRIEMTGSLEARACELRYIAGDQTLAVATIGRDRISLVRELAMEREAMAATMAVMS